jgi:hypothetical protein
MKVDCIKICGLSIQRVGDDIICRIQREDKCWYQAAFLKGNDNSSDTVSVARLAMSVKEKI